MLRKTLEDVHRNELRPVREEVKEMKESPSCWDNFKSGLKLLPENHPYVSTALGGLLVAGGIVAICGPWAPIVAVGVAIGVVAKIVIGGVVAALGAMMVSSTGYINRESISNKWHSLWNCCPKKEESQLNPYIEGHHTSFDSNDFKRQEGCGSSVSSGPPTLNCFSR